MAVLQKIRSNLVAQLAIGLGMVAFIVTGFVTCSRGPKEQENTVAKLNGEELERMNFDQQVDEYKNFIRIMRQSPLDYNFSNEEDLQIREAAYQRFIEQNLLKKECEELGLTVTDNELANIIKEGTHPLLSQFVVFTGQDRTFDYAVQQNFMKQYKELQNKQVTPEQAEYFNSIYRAWLFMEEELRNTVLSEKYQNLLCSLILSNPISAKASYEGRVNETEIVMAVLPYSSVADADFKANDAEMKAKLEEYQDAYWQNPNTGEIVPFYTISESREIKYIDMDIKPSDADKAAINAEMNGYATALATEGIDIDSLVTVSKSKIGYTKLPMSKTSLSRLCASAAVRIDSMEIGTQTEVYLNPADTTLNIVRLLDRVNRPDSIEVREIGIQNTDIAAAQATADSLINVLKAGEPFDSIAKRMDQPGTKHWITGNMYEGVILGDANLQVIQSAVAGNTGEYKTITMDGGVLLMQITDRRAFETKYDVAIIQRKMEFSPETYKNKLDELRTLVNNSKDANEIESKAIKSGLNVQKETIYKGSFNLSRVNVRGTREIIRWAFNPETEVGAILDPKAYGYNSDHLIVAILTGINPAGKATLENEKVKEACGMMVVQDKKAAQLQEKMKNAKSIEDVAKIQGVVTDSIPHITYAAPAYIMSVGGAQEPVISGAASALAEGKFVAGLRGNAGIYAIKVVKKSKTDAPYDEKVEMQNDAMQNANIVYSMCRQPIFRGSTENFDNIFYPILKDSKFVDNRTIFY